MEQVISFKAIKEVFYKYIERIIEKHQTDGGLSAGEQEERGDRGPADSVGRQDVAVSVWSQECGRQNRATTTFHQNMNARNWLPAGGRREGLTRMLATRTWPPGSGQHEQIARTWPQGCDHQDVAARTWLLGCGCQDVATRTWLPEQSRQDGNARTWMPGRGCQDMADRNKLLGHGRQDAAARGWPSGADSQPNFHHLNLYTVVIKEALLYCRH